MVYGVGVIGSGKHKSSEKGIPTKKYRKWVSMIGRCYDEKVRIKNPSYNNCTVSKCWLDFQNFGDWYDDNFREGCQLDKDILIKGNEIYGPDTCCFVPLEVNYLIIRNKRGEYPVGVSKRLNKFHAFISLNNKNTRLGSFDTVEEAFQAYKTAKEKHIKEVVNEYYEKGEITFRVYEALNNYIVEITD